MPSRLPLPPMLLLLVLAGLASSCRHVAEHAGGPAGRVGYEAIVPPSAKEFVLAPNQTFALGEPVAPVAMPAYPPALLPLGPAAGQRVCVSVVVTAEGAVASVTPMFHIPDCPLGEAETRKEFVSAVVDAVSGWEFYSSQVCTFPAGAPAGNRCSGPGVEIVPVAVTQSFQFVFSIEDGIGTVTRGNGG